MRPVIGITAGDPVVDRTAEAGAEALCVARAGGSAVGLPCDTGTAVADTVRRLDGLILSGGADVDPTSYGEPRRHQAVKSNPARAAEALAVLEAAEALDLPTLAICRGIHVLNVACGGTLYQDLPTQRAEGLSHRQSGPPSALAHDVLIEPDSKLRAILGADSVSVTLDFEEKAIAGASLGSGGIIVADEDTCAVDMTRVLVAFCQFESCGKCFPCRLGTANLLEIVERIARFEGRPGDLDLMRSIGKTMTSGSLCGHGQLGFLPIGSAIQHFEADFRAHIEEKRCPTGSCLKPMVSPQNTRPFALDLARTG